LKKLAIVSLIALICWLYPIKVLGQKTDEPKTKPTEDYISKDLIITNNAIQRFHQNPSSRSSLQPSTGFNNGGATQPSSGVYSGRHYSKDEVQALIRQYAASYGISANLPLAVARCESGYNQFAKNKSSSASGVYQWLSSSWANQPAAAGGVSVFDADANVRAAVWLIAHGKISPWNSSINCWK
jgi:hypothetical protein